MHPKHNRIAAWITIGVIATCVLSSVALVALAQEPVEPAKYTSNFAVEYELTAAQVKKLEAKAIEIIRRKGTVTGEQATRAEALAIVRPNGVTDVAVCFEYVSTDRLFGIAQATVRGVQIQRIPAPRASN